MKNVIFIIIALIFISCKNEDEILISDSIIGTWGLYKEINDDTVIIVDFTNPNEQILFKQNGTWESNSYGLKLKGSWKKLNDTKYLFSSIKDGITTYTEIEFIDNSEYVQKFTHQNWKYYKKI